jgi:glycosyltransferase involved in cell wall biosynthesis
MRIAYIGIKGLPGSFSGIETHVHELGTRLADRGHDVAAYVRANYTPKSVRRDGGMRLIHRPSIHTKHLDASVHSLIAAVDTLRTDYDIVHFHAIGPAAFSPIARISRARVVTTIHRFDYLSEKWGPIARGCLRTAESVALRASDATVVIAKWLAEHYWDRGHDVEFIPNGVPLPQLNPGGSCLDQYDLAIGEYYLFLGRLVPEKRPHWAIQAFLDANIQRHRKLVITGGSSATESYVRELREMANADPSRIVLTGPLFGQAKDQLLANARAFLLPSALEGLPITLLEAMSYARPCLVSAIPPHTDVIRTEQNGYLHDPRDREDLTKEFARLDRMRLGELEAVGRVARETVAAEFNWEEIVDSTEALYSSLAGA